MCARMSVRGVDPQLVVLLKRCVFGLVGLLGLVHHLLAVSEGSKRVTMDMTYVFLPRVMTKACQHAAVTEDLPRNK